jgi:hypothetical protein
MKRTALSSALVAALSLLSSNPAAADAVSDLRAEFGQALEQLRQTYEARIRNLEERLQAAEAKADTAQQSSEQAAAAAQAATPPVTANSFNPEVSLILQGRYAYRDDVEERTLTGFIPAGHEHGEAGRGFSLDHTELVFAANIDPYFRGFANLALLDEEVEVEEAWFQTLALGHGLTLKGGRFFSSIGYMNEQHPHMWDFVDTALMYQALFGESYIADGLQAKWIAPTDLLVELSAEADWGGNFPGTDQGDNGPDAYTLGLHLGGDVGASHSWRGGISYLFADADDREFEGHDPDDVEVAGTFSGDSRTWIADFVWKWAPDGNPRYRNFKFQAEYFWREDDGRLNCDDHDPDEPSTCTGGLSGDYDSDQTGWYAQAVYQFMPRWRVGYRYDHLDADSVDFLDSSLGNFIASLEDFSPRRHSLMVDYSPSEFSRLRLQYARDESMEGLDEDQVTLQYIYSLGAHGAHKF